MNIQNKGTFTVLIFVIAAFVLTLGVASATDYYVATTGNDTTGDGSIGSPWGTIQHAVDTVPAGDTIIVRDGTYTENVMVENEQNLTIRSENGSENCIVTANDTDRAVFYLWPFFGELTRVNISGFTIQNATGENNNNAGILLWAAEHCTISDNIVTNNYRGIKLHDHSNNNTIMNNSVLYNNDSGIFIGDASNNNTLMNNNASFTTNSIGIQIYFADNNTLTNNTATNNNGTGIWLYSSNNNTLIGNIANWNWYDGISLGDSTYNNLTGNTANSNYDGIDLDNSDYNNLTGNTANSNIPGTGIYLYSSANNNLIGNTANANNQYGIELYSWEDNSDNNNLINNTANENGITGIDLYYADYNNLINNTANSNYKGIALYDSFYNKLTNNTANENDYGIHLIDESDYNNLTGNTANENGYEGIYLDDSWDNNLIGNTANENGGVGIHLQNADNNNLTGNTATSNYYDGIFLFVSDNNNLTGNTATSNGNNGIYLSDSQNNMLLDNLAAGHKYSDFGEESFDVLLLEGASWTYQGELSFSNYETRELQLTHSAGVFTLRLSQHGHDSAYVDYVALKKGDSLYEPATAVNLDSGADICYKLVTPDDDVSDAWQSTLELTWDSVPADTTLVMRAMEEDLGPGHGSPLYYPLLREGRTLSHTLVNDGGITVDGVLAETNEPTFSVFWRPDSPHPDGFTHGWLHADDQYVYAAVEVTSDNTPDGEDWGALFIMVNGELRKFRVAPAEMTWGQIGFQYTSAVPYEHRIYEFAIPLSELNAQPGDELHYGFGAYGTVSLDYAGIELRDSDNNNLTGNRVTDNDIGIYLANAPWNTITCNAVYKNTQAGFHLEYGSVNNTIAQNGIVANGGIIESGKMIYCNLRNDQNAQVNATYNYWGTGVSAEIHMGIYDGWGEATVTYEPFLYEWPPCAPGVPVLEVSKTVWNGMAWVKEVEDAYVNDALRFNCTITNIGGVNLTQLRFWDILDCSLVYAGDAMLIIPGEETPINLSETPYHQQPYDYTFKQRFLHPNKTYGGTTCEEMPGYLWDPYDPLSSCFFKGELKVPIFDELCPESKLHYLHGWNDTNNDGRVSTCDQLWLESYEEWYHVEHVPYTLVVNNTETGESMYLESVSEGYVDYEDVDLSEPEYTTWIGIRWSEACCVEDWYDIEAWNDTDADGNLSVNDTILLWNMEIDDEEELPRYTVTEIAIDLVVSMEWEVDHLLNNSIPPEPQPTAGAFALKNVFGSNRVTGPIEPLNLFVLEPCQSLTLEYNATVVRCGEDMNIFQAKGNYEGDWTYSNEDIVYVEVLPRPAVETNLTVWNGTAWAKAVTVLVNDTLNFSWSIHNNGSCCDLEWIYGELTVANDVIGRGIDEDLAPCTEVNGTLEVPALECGTYTVWWNVSAECWGTEEAVTAKDTVTVTVLCPELEVNKTVWNGTAWVKSLNASMGETVRFNCTIKNTGNVNLSEIRFWDILDCSLDFSGNETLDLSGEVKDISLEGTYVFKPRVLHSDNLSWDSHHPLPAVPGPYPEFTELCPNNETWYLQGWEDTNNDTRVSACDQLEFEGAYSGWYHVDRVPCTLLVNNTETKESKYLDSALDYESINLSMPNGTEWFGVCCGKDRYTLTAWYDTNVTEDLNVNDTMLLQNERTGEVAQYTVEEVAIDLVVSREWEIDKLPVPAQLLFEPNQTITIEYNATVVRCGVDNNTFQAKGNYSNVWTYSNEDVVTITVPCPTGDATDPTGTVKEVYTDDEDVYVKGSNFDPIYNGTMDIYIFDDGKWSEGLDISTLPTPYANLKNVSIDANGTVGPVKIWEKADTFVGDFDVFFDANGDGIYIPFIDAVDDPNHPGFSIIGLEQVPALTPLGIAALTGLLSIIAISTIERKKRR